MESLLISNTNITKEDLLRISDMLKPYDEIRTNIFIQSIGQYLEPENIKDIKERGLPDEIQIDADLYDAMCKDYEDRFKDSALQHESLFHLTGIRITKLKLKHENQVILIWNTKPLVNGSIGIFGGDFLDMKSRMDWYKQCMIDIMGIPIFATNPGKSKLVSSVNDDKQDNV